MYICIGKYTSPTEWTWDIPGYWGYRQRPIASPISLHPPPSILTTSDFRLDPTCNCDSPAVNSSIESSPSSSTSNISNASRSTVVIGGNSYNKFTFLEDERLEPERLLHPWKRNKNKLLDHHGFRFHSWKSSRVISRLLSKRSPRSQGGW